MLKCLHKKSIVDDFTMRKITFAFLVFLFFLLCISCFHIEQNYTGTIKDADSQKPLKDVIVFLELSCHCILPPNPGGPSSEYIGHKETLTDAQGRYNLPFGFYLMKPLMCFADEPTTTLFKSGYFPGGRSYKKLEKDPVLFRMNHYLNYLPYEKNDYYIESIISNFKKSKLLNKTNLTNMKHIHLDPADEMGVFFRSPGRKFTRMISTSVSDDSDPLVTNSVFFVYDESAKEWLCIDSRGKVIDLKNNPPKNRGEFIALPGTYRDSFEIEDNGNSICKDNSRVRVSRQLDPSSINPPLTCFTVKDLPTTKEDDSLVYTKFIYSAAGGNGYFVVTRTLKFWHIYNFNYEYDYETKTIKMKIRKLLSFPIGKDITALATRGYDFFLAFKNEGIKKFIYIVGANNVSIREDEKFYLNSSRLGKLNINSISFGSAVNMGAIYATTGDEKIYRFSEADGTPDYIIKPINFD